ncbi:L-lactate dehydrogenase [Lyngbya sp. CCY1209]|uniref:L-lactate dehydrogenase n=1 Tax=Lyngbya sp. CCY1209 TaxID=2886103 RepID=UPI002D2084C9|nr:L-lactate dehydrogenase [Lyngbya sp. CCY1209]MEB3883650.1 L-lactate dehydrogenase [Lyngbya sp. CCY1209]
MLPQLFSVPTDIDEGKSQTYQPLKGVIVGAGQVGMSSAYSMLIQNVFDEMLVVDVDRKKAEGEVMDLNHGLPFVEPTDIRAGSWEDANDPDLVILTAGSKQKPGETRLDLLQRNTKIFKSIVPEAVKHCPNAIFLVVTNPVDIMTYVTLKISGLPSHRVLGSGTVLDTARFRFLLAEKLDIDPRSLHAYIIGEHGDSEVPVWSKVNIAGMNLCDGNSGDLPEDEKERLEPVFEAVKNAAYEIIDRKGATYYAIGLGVTQIAKAILRDQHRIFTVSHLIEGLHDIEDVCLSLPAVVSRQGVTRVLNLALSDTEKKQLQNSAKVMRENIEKLEL